VIALDAPVVQAPLAGGPSTPELAAAVSNAGGLGFVAAGYISSEALSEQLARTHALTEKPFGANLFVLAERPVDDLALHRYARELEPDARHHGVALGEPRFEDDGFAAKLAVVAAARVPVVSTTFAQPPGELVRAVHAYGGEVWATITSPAEATAAERAGADALVLQGSEAGGHRGSWEDDDGPDLSLLDLLRAVDVRIPVVAAGGIVDREATADALELGAVAVQAGTAFLLAPEAGTSGVHRDALTAPGSTAVTRAFTGRRARGIVNEFMTTHTDAPSAYPHIHHLTAPLRAAARAAGDAERVNLWAGASYARVQARPAAEILARLRP
jgi:nitronate monooxygenase